MRVNVYVKCCSSAINVSVSRNLKVPSTSKMPFGMPQQHGKRLKTLWFMDSITCGYPHYSDMTRTFFTAEYWGKNSCGRVAVWWRSVMFRHPVIWWSIQKLPQYWQWCSFLPSDDWNMWYCVNVNSDDTVIAINIISLWKQMFLLTVKSFTNRLIYCMEQRNK